MCQSIIFKIACFQYKIEIHLENYHRYGIGTLDIILLSFEFYTVFKSTIDHKTTIQVFHNEFYTVFKTTKPPYKCFTLKFQNINLKVLEPLLTKVLMYFILFYLNHIPNDF